MKGRNVKVMIKGQRRRSTRLWSMKEDVRGCLRRSGRCFKSFFTRREKKESKIIKEMMKKKDEEEDEDQQETRSTSSTSCLSLFFSWVENERSTLSPSLHLHSPSS
jgi:hypothetical protein